MAVELGAMLTVDVCDKPVAIVTVFKRAWQMEEPSLWVPGTGYWALGIWYMVYGIW